MKKILFLFASICVSILTKAQDAPITTCIFLINENGKSNQVFTNSKFPSRLAFEDGDIVEINPNSVPRFIDQDGIELSFDARTPGVFMNKDGDLVVPCANKAKSPKIVDPNPKGSKSRTNENTTANLKNKDRENFIIGEVDVPTNNPKLKIRCIGGGGETIRYNVIFSDDKKRFNDFNRLITLNQFRSENTGAGEVLTNAKLLGEKLIELSEQCKGENQPNFCDQPNDGRRFTAKRESLLEELRKIPGFVNLDLELDLITGLNNIK